MSNQRIGLAKELVSAMGSGFDQIVDIGNGWPSRVQLKLGDDKILVDLYVSLVGSHARREYERRFQNPADESQRLITMRDGAIPVLVGLSRQPEGRIIAVLPDTDLRVGNTNRFSVLFRKELEEDAGVNHWSEYYSSSGELITAMRPELIPHYLMVKREVGNTSLGEIRTAISDSIDSDGLIGEITRKAVMRVVRSAKFRKEVTKAYSGRCILCGLNWGLIQAAHIYPISAPNSSDSLHNGLGLCGNHHALFDAHQLYIDPEKLTVTVDKELYVNAGEAGVRFLETTIGNINLPPEIRRHESQEWLEKRYDWFGERYGWAV
ncbi:MAG: HNH endonuclease [Opitutaceae bacterium]